MEECEEIDVFVDCCEESIEVQVHEVPEVHEVPKAQKVGVISGVKRERTY